MSINYSVGTPTANSYVSVGLANTYFSERVISDGWTNISVNSTGTLTATAQKERLLKQATREIDSAYRFQQRKYNDYTYGDDNYQALEFPRSYNFDVDGYPYIPDEVQWATCEQALWILERGGKKTTNEGTTIERQLIGDEAMGYLKSHITSTVKSTGVWAWR
jgi:hypothetical protein